MSNKTTEILVPYAFEALDPPPEAASLTASVYEPGGPPVAALLTQPGGASFVRYRVDGGDPSATVGHVIPEGAGGVVLYGAKAIKAARLIEPDEAQGINVTYFRGGN